MKTVIVLMIISLLSTQLQALEDDTILSQSVEKEFLIIKSTTSYDEAEAFSKQMAKKLSIKLDLRGLVFNKKSFLTFSKTECQDFGYPYYLGRGRYDDGEYISIEHSSFYDEFKDGYYIVVVASGDSILSSLKKVKKIVPDAYVKKEKIYMGCVH